MDKDVLQHLPVVTIIAHPFTQGSMFHAHAVKAIYNAPLGNETICYEVGDSTAEAIGFLMCALMTHVGPFVIDKIISLEIPKESD